MIKNISNLGDASVYCDFGSEVNENINSEVIKYFNYLSKLVKNKKIEGITNLSPSYNKLIISFDLSLLLRGRLWMNLHRGLVLHLSSLYYNIQ